MEEAPRKPAEVLAQKFELLSREAADKHFPGLKDEFDQALEARSSEALDEPAFWEQVELLFSRYDVDQEKLERILADR